MGGEWYKSPLMVDNWHDDSPLLEKYEEKAIYDLGLKRHTKVSYFIKDNRRNYPRTNMMKLMEISKRLRQLFLGNKEMVI